MSNRFQNKIVLIVGSTGGLGSVFARAFADEGAKLILAGRDEVALNGLAADLNANAKIFSVDVTDVTRLNALHDFIRDTFGKVDVVVNASGMDVRKPFAEHSVEDVRRTLSVNLMGAILLTQTFLPILREQNDGVVVHIGGFADGRLAFPYYTANVASRAGLFSFVESLNRELKLEGSNVVVSYFSPSAADTKAEQPFHAIWREMGLAITPKEKVAADLLEAVEKRERVYIMGGISTVSFAKLNSIFPQLADRLLLDGYGKILKKFLANKNETEPAQNSSWQRWLGIGLIALSFALYGGLFVLPFIPFSTEGEIAVSPVLVILGETSFWVGGVLVGKEMVTRYKKYLNPCNWRIRI